MIENITIQPLTPKFGAKILGLDLSSPLSDEQISIIKKSLFYYGILFFGKQSLSPDEQLAFCRQLGEIYETEDSPILNKTHKTVNPFESEKGKTVSAWHTAQTFKKNPPIASVLQAKIMPHIGGTTLWRSMSAAYYELSPAIKDLIDKLYAIHDLIMTPGGYRTFQFDIRTGRTRETANKNPPIEHPVVITHPETNSKALYVNPAYTHYIKNLSWEESDYLLQFLHQHSAKPEYMYRHDWQEGDVIMWDNWTTQHRGVDGFYGKRSVHRVVIKCFS